MISITPPVQSAVSPVAALPARSNGDDADELSFGDLLDAINPLQQLPVVGDIYRAITGDSIGAPARIVGGAIYGGVVGLIGAIGALALEEASGSSIEDMMTSMLAGRGDPGGREMLSAYRDADYMTSDAMERVSRPTGASPVSVTL